MASHTPKNLKFWWFGKNSSIFAKKNEDLIAWKCIVMHKPYKKTKKSLYIGYFSKFLKWPIFRKLQLIGYQNPISPSPSIRSLDLTLYSQTFIFWKDLYVQISTNEHNFWKRQISPESFVTLSLCIMKPFNSIPRLRELI